MQNGFATLEIIFATLIIALLMSTAIPNATRIVDRVSLDYETKRLYSELRFLEAMSKTAKAYGTGAERSIVGEGLSIEFTPNPPSYQVVRGSGYTKTPVRESHNLSYGAKISLKSGKKLSKLSYDESNKWNIGTDTLILTSRLGKTRSITINSVGRIRGEH